MLQPKDFEVNEAWIAFRLNSVPIQTEEDGDFNCIALMDAASCSILSSDLIPAEAAGPTQLEFRHLVESAQRDGQQLPGTLFVPPGEFFEKLVAEATKEGIEVVTVSERELLIFTGEARQGFAEQFGGPSH